LNGIPKSRKRSIPFSKSLLAKQEPGVDLLISSGEIGRSFDEIHKSVNDLPISLEEIGKSPEEIGISSREICISLGETERVKVDGVKKNPKRERGPHLLLWRYCR